MFAVFHRIATRVDKKVEWFAQNTTLENLPLSIIIIEFLIVCSLFFHFMSRPWQSLSSIIVRKTI